MIKTYENILLKLPQFSAFLGGLSSMYVWLKLLSHLLALELTAMETENSETLTETDPLVQISVLFVSPLPVLLGDSLVTN